MSLVGACPDYTFGLSQERKRYLEERMCVGCRGAAYAYLGDPWASDPKCWLNPEAKEYYLSPERSGVGWEES